MRRGGANNRADRVTRHLSRRQVEDILAAARYAEARGWAFSRHWTVHCEKAGIPDCMAADFVTRLLTIARKAMKRRGIDLVVIWVRENSMKNGSHVHILMHLSRPLHLRNLTRKWIEAAGGYYRQRVSRVRTIGGRLGAVDATPDYYWANADVVARYLLKGCSASLGKQLGLTYYGREGEVTGKRAGWSQSIGAAARRRAN